MDVLEAIRQRRAVRDYKLDTVPHALLRQMIDAANWAPSAMNGQPWRFIVITDADLLKRISDGAKRWTLDHEPAADASLKTLLADPNFHLFHHAPALIVIATAAPTRWGQEGCALAAENLMLAGTGLGLGSCWIGLAEGFLNSAEGRDLIKLPAGDHVVAPIAVGHARGLLKPVARRAPHIVWIEEEHMTSEDGVAPQPVLGRGLYGALARP